MRRRLPWLVGLLLLAGATGCSERAPRQAGARPAPTPTARSSPSPGWSAPAGCPAGYAAPDPYRPAVGLTFDLAADRRTVAGTERVRFTPDLPVTELVFRLWPNGAAAPAGTSLTVTKVVTTGGGHTMVAESLGGRPGTQGTLISVPLPRTAPPGTEITADLAFRLVLPAPHFERWGSSGSTAWWGSGHPLLAWEHGRGWQRQPAVRFPSEAAVSEAAQTDITVTAATGDTVLVTGIADPPSPLAGGRTRWHATSASARDVSVAVGHFTTRTASVAGVAVTVGVASEVRASPDELLRQTRRSIEALVRRYGPFPFPSLVVSALPALSSGGIEFPGAIQVGPIRWRVVLPHEAAHEYFYGMLGNNQARDPWLDEAFATYSESLVNADQSDYLPALGLPGTVGGSTGSWGDNEVGYYMTVYNKGAAALLTARAAAGPAAFDAALRCYLRANAWTVTTPDDVARALAGLPPAIVVLRRAGALP
jgi:hypothetical protein